MPLKKLIVEENDFEVSVPRSILCFKLIRIVNSLLNEKHFSYLYRGSNVTFY